MAEHSPAKNQEIITLAREILDDVEMDRMSATRAVLKATRLARLTAATSIQEWLWFERYGYSHVFPEDAGFQLEAVALGWATRDGAIRELEAKIRRDPSCFRARRLLEAVVTSGVE